MPFIPRWIPLRMVLRANGSQKPARIPTFASIHQPCQPKPPRKVSAQIRPLTFRGGPQKALLGGRFRIIFIFFSVLGRGKGGSVRGGGRGGGGVLKKNRGRGGGGVLRRGRFNKKYREGGGF